MKEMVGGCCVCSDDRGWAENPLVYCDGQGCTVAVHQACYGIVTVPSGNWYCRKCESPERSARTGPRQQHCELCPSRDGAIKRTDNNGWAHVVCALYIPEVRFGNVTTMEPILLQHIPSERFNKVCYICEESGKGTRSTVGACMQCNKSGCKQQFHVTCAQALGLLCEEAGNYLDNVKYCGYCQHHYSKLKKGANVKTVPPYRPVTTDSPPSPDKDSGENWSKPPGKRKLSTCGKSASTAQSGSKSSSGKTSGTTSPAPTAAEPATSAAPALDTSTPIPPVPPASSALTSESPATPLATDAPVNGKVAPPNIVESVVAASGSVFSDSGKSSKKRKSQAKDESPPQPSAIVSPPGATLPVNEEKRLKVDLAPLKPDALSPTPSVLVKVPTASPATSPATTTSPIAATSSIVVSVPLAVASLPTPTPVTAAPPVLPAATPPAADDAPGKRGRSQSTEKSDKGRKQKRGGSAVSKRGGRSSQPTPPPGQTSTPTPPVIMPTATAAVATAPAASAPAPVPVVMPVSQSLVIKESPPSSPDSKQKIKKPSREEKDKLFQNGVSAPHMLGNQLNPASTMAQKMSDTLNQELEAHSIFTAEPNLSTQPGQGQLVGPQLHSRVIASVRGSGAGTPPASSGGGGGGGWGPNNTATPQTLDQLLERQWEQGSQFLMEQAQHFDIASLLTCLHQLRAENLRLEEHVSSLQQRRDHLLAVNARLAIPLVPPQTVNNIHPGTASNAALPMDGSRPVPVTQPPRMNNAYPPGGVVENGPTSPSQPYHPNKSNSQPSSNHPQAGYPSMYSVPPPHQSQIVMRRDISDLHHQIPSSKPS